MKQLTLAVLIVAILCVLVAPTLAQRGNSPRQGLPLVGKVLEADAKQQTARLALLVLAPTADAPGKVPSEIAQRVAEMTARADELERRKRDPQLLQQLRDWIEKAQRWREIELPITAGDHIPMVGIKRIPLADIPRGIRLRLAAYADGAQPENQVPEHVMLNNNPMQVGPRAKAFARRIPPPKNATSTFYELVGEVTTVSPLTLQIEGHSVVVDTTPRFSFIAQKPTPMSELRPGCTVFVRAQMTSWNEVGKINRIVILFDGQEGPLTDEDDVEL